VMGFVVERAVEGEKVGLAEEGFEVDQGDVEGGGDFGIGVGIVGEVTHAERLGEAEYFGADVADADEAEGTAFEPQTKVTDPVLPTTGAEVALFDGEAVAEGEEHGEDGFGHGTAYAVGGVGDDDAGAGAGVGIDGVVTDAEAGEDGEAVGGRQGVGGETLDAGDDGVESSDVIGSDLGSVGHEFVVGGDFTEDINADIPGWEVAVVVEEVGGEADAEGLWVQGNDPLRV